MSVGAQLQQARQERKLSLPDVTRETKIQPWVLEALESNRLQDMMSPVYVKGFLSTYARFLRLNPATLVTELPGTRPPEPVVANEELPPPAQAPIPVIPFPWPVLRRLGAGVAVAAMIAGLVVANPLKALSKVSLPTITLPKLALPTIHLPQFAKAGGQKKTAKAAPKAAKSPKPAEVAAKPAPAAPRVATAAAAPAAGEPARSALQLASVTPIAEIMKPPAPPAPTVIAAQPLELTLAATKTTWVRVKADGKLVAQQRIGRGSTEHWKAKKQFEVIIAKPSQVELALNGQSITPFALAHQGHLLITHQGVTRLPAD